MVDLRTYLFLQSTQETYLIDSGNLRACRGTTSTFVVDRRVHPSSGRVEQEDSSNNSTLIQHLTLLRSSMEHTLTMSKSLDLDQLRNAFKEAYSMKQFDNKILLTGLTYSSSSYLTLPYSAELSIGKTSPRRRAIVILETTQE